MLIEKDCQHVTISQNQSVCIYKLDDNYLQTFSILSESDCSHSKSDSNRLQKGCRLSGEMRPVVRSILIYLLKYQYLMPPILIQYRQAKYLSVYAFEMY